MVVLFGASLSGCLLEGSPPNLDPNKPATCGNGICDAFQTENCTNCPEECACCEVVNAAGVVQATVSGDVPEVQGPADGAMIALDSNSEVVLAVGGEWIDRVPPTPNTPLYPEFTIHGAVTTNDAPYTGCLDKQVSGTGAFEILVSDGASAFERIGLWTSRATQFDLSCATLSHIRYIKIRGQFGAKGQLDTITPLQGACLTAQGVE